MSVSNLETPEKGMNLQTRGRGRRAGAAEGDLPDAEAGAELDAMRERIAAARVVEPEGGFRCCSHCAQAFVSGRNAAIKVIEGE